MSEASQVNVVALLFKKIVSNLLPLPIVIQLHWAAKTRYTLQILLETPIMGIYFIFMQENAKFPSPFRMRSTVNTVGGIQRELWVGCEGKACWRWWHYPCVGLPRLPKDNETWICPICCLLGHGFFVRWPRLYKYIWSILIASDHDYSLDSSNQYSLSDYITLVLNLLTTENIPLSITNSCHSTTLLLHFSVLITQHQYSTSDHDLSFYCILVYILHYNISLLLPQFNFNSPPPAKRSGNETRPNP